jgi:fluoroquinolone transport system permease protein
MPCDMGKYGVLIRNDFKLIFRDGTLRIFLFMPGLILLVVFLLIPSLEQQYEGVTPFVPLILMAATVQTSTMFGFIYCMVLIHEKDMHIAKVYGILPVSKLGFLASRLAIPFLIAVAITFVILLFQPFFPIGLLPNVLLSLLSGLLTPLLAIVVSILSKNKMEGLSWFKVMNLLVAIPLAAYFIPAYFHFFGILPTHWIFYSLDCMVKEQSYVMPLGVGYLFFATLLLFVGKRFVNTHFV